MDLKEIGFHKDRQEGVQGSDLCYARLVYDIRFFLG